jgi:hypothetical protein
MKSVVEALAAIPDRRDALNDIDDQLSGVIRCVETALNNLRVGVSSSVNYATTDGTFYLGYGKRDGQWRITVSFGLSDVSIHNAPRHVRAEIFSREGSNLSPIERLIVATAEQLATLKDDRSLQLSNALRLKEMLEASGFSVDGNTALK